MEPLNSLYYRQGGHENTTCRKSSGQLRQQALWEVINLGGHLHKTLTDDLGLHWLIGWKLLCYV